MLVKKPYNFLVYIIILFFGGISPVDASGYYTYRDKEIVDALNRVEDAYSKKVASTKNREIIIDQTLTAAASHQVSAEKKPIIVNSDQKNLSLDQGILKREISRTGSLVRPVASLANVSDPKDVDQDSLAYRYCDLDNPQNELEVGSEIFDYSYREEGLMKLDGMMYGVFMDYQHRYSENPQVDSWGDFIGSNAKINLLMVDARLAGGGDIKYISEGTGEHEGEDHYAFETRVMGGCEFPWKSRGFVLVPYGGIGYRYVVDDNGGSQTTTGHWGYDRESHYYYIPLGIEAHKFYYNGWKTRLIMEYDWFLAGKQYSHLEDAPGYSQTLYNEQTKGYGIRGALKLAKEGERFEFFIEPFVRYWHIDDSKYGQTSETAGIEPNNRTEEYGARVGVKW